MLFGLPVAFIVLAAIVFIALIVILRVVYTLPDPEELDDEASIIKYEDYS